MSDKPRIVGIQNVKRTIDGGFGICFDGIPECFMVLDCTVISRELPWACHDGPVVLVKGRHIVGCTEDELIYWPRKDGEA